MSIWKKLKVEVKALTLATVYFGLWIGVLMILKTLILAEYSIEFHGVSLVMFGALILTKVVILLERVSFGKWIESQPAFVDVLLRSVIYSVGVFVFILFEKALEGRQEHGGLRAALAVIFQHAEVHHVLANTICMSGALVGYNALAVVRRNLGKGGLIRMFMSPLPSKSVAANPYSHSE